VQGNVINQLDSGRGAKLSLNSQNHKEKKENGERKKTAVCGIYSSRERSRAGTADAVVECRVSPQADLRFAVAGKLGNRAMGGKSDKARKALLKPARRNGAVC